MGKTITSFRPKSLLSNAAWNLFLTAWTTGVSFFYTPFLIRHIGSDYYGLFVLLMSLSGLLGIMNLGLGEATLRYTAYYYGRQDISGINRVVGSTLSVYTAVSLAIAAVIFPASPFIVKFIAVPPGESALGIKLLRITAVTFSLKLFSGAVGSIPGALQRYDIRTKVMIAENIFQLAGTVALVLTGYGIYHLVLWSLITALFIQAVHMRVAKRLIPLLRLTPLFAKDGIKEVFGYGIFSSLGQFLTIIRTQADRLILGALVSTSAVAYLTVPQTIALRAAGAVGSAGAALFPKFSATKDPEELQSLFLNATWISLCATVVIFVPVTILFPDFLRLWINPEFAEKSAWVGQIIAGSCIVRGAFIPYDALFRGIGKPQYLTVLFTCAAVTSLGLNFVMIPRFGLAGAGYCYCITPLWGFIGITFTLRKVLGIPSLRPFFHSVALPCMLGFLVLFLLSALRRSFMETPGWIELFVIGALFAGITAAVVLGTEQLLRGSDSHTQSLANHVRRILAAHPRILPPRRSNYGRPPEA